MNFKDALKGALVGAAIGVIAVAVLDETSFQKGYQAGRRSASDRIEVAEQALRQCQAHPQQFYANNNHPMKRMWFTGEKKWPE